ncbi:ATP-binding cassette domain-containing protein [Phytoactinopolyspora endophytica]|uniref:ATP-binding cassette domain-containing protein n=1 Tax=Phytoactinopolyspora endophytica TaxID=1642495 RepID=UPI00101DFB58|nr:ABC transporter ATP-binding protein [Phytoactinopolyspora endophytica]
MTANLLDMRDVEVEYPGKGWRAGGFRALQGVSLDIREGETVGLVGESGSGKTTLGRAVLGLARVTSGRIDYRGRDIAHLSRRERRALSSEIQVVFQDPYSSLNPAMTIQQILSEPLTTRGADAESARARVAYLLDQVHLPHDAGSRLPREFSGGQRQRIAIARALALDPRLIVCDEPVSALDLSTQAHVLDLFIEIQERTGVAYLFISHDLAVVRHISHRVAVMYRGEIVESGDGAQVTGHPEHPYTQRLFMAAPVPDPDRQAQRRADRHRLVTQHAEADEQAGAAVGVGWSESTSE